jgi:hypothetical protein
VRITTRQLAKCKKNSGLASKHTNHSPVWQVSFSLSFTLSNFGQFSDLAGENTELLTNLASVLKNLFTPLHTNTQHAQKETKKKIKKMKHIMLILYEYWNQK